MTLYFVGYDTMKYNGENLILIATDPDNKNTFSRWKKAQIIELLEAGHSLINVYNNDEK